MHKSASSNVTINFSKRKQWAKKMKTIFSLRKRNEKAKTINGLLMLKKGEKNGSSDWNQLMTLNKPKIPLAGTQTLLINKVRLFDISFFFFSTLLLKYSCLHKTFCCCCCYFCDRRSLASYRLFCDHTNSNGTFEQ